MMKWIPYIILLQVALPAAAQDSVQFRMSDFIGINTNVASYDQNYIDDLARCTKWIREYHSWSHYEPANDSYKWDDFTQHPHTYSWPHHTKFMEECQRLGINVLIDVLNKPGWAGAQRGAYTTGDGTKADDYLERLEFMGQLVARYGAQKIEASKLETADKKTGLNYIKYYEDDNEPDYWWESPRWPAEKYAVYCNAVHDGYGVETSETYPLMGIKSVDSTAVHVLAGMTGEGLSYIQKILDNSNGRIPFDVLNIHTYCKDETDGYSPENEKYGLEKNLGAFVNWCQNNLPEIPIWLTEFGWDTYITNGVHSYIYAPEAQQANYILRSFLISLKMGFEKAFLFMGRDPNSTSTIQYSSSGILTDNNTGLQKKPSFFYLSTMQKVLGNAVLNDIKSYRQLLGNNEIFCFEFLNESNERIYALWTREKNSKTDNGTTIPYVLNIGYQPESAKVIVPKDKKLFGEKTDLELNGPTINLTLSETPQFVVVSQTKTALLKNKKNNLKLEVYPNPAAALVHISFYNPKSQHFRISVLNADGKLVETIEENTLYEGKQNYSFGDTFSRGIYFVVLNSDTFRSIEKVLIR